MRKPFDLPLIALAFLFSAAPLPGDAHAQEADCHLLTSSHSVPAGFGAPYNTLSSSRELLLTATCTDTSATLSAGTGSNIQYIYEQGYEWRDNEWHPFTYSGANKIGPWLIGQGSATRSRSAAEMAGNNFFVAYLCTWTGRSWKCGCRDAACATPYWQLQGFRDNAAGTISDDTFACIEDGKAEITLKHDYGYSQYKKRDMNDSVAIDARRASWNHQQVPDSRNLYPVNIGGGRNICFAGGTIVGTSDENASWFDLYTGGGTSLGDANSASIAVSDAPGFVVDGVRIHNTWDPLRVHDSENFNLRNAWISRTRDDCVENDEPRSGTVEDSLFDGCYVGFSSRARHFDNMEFRDKTVEIRGVVMRLQPFPGAHDDGINLQPGHKGFFKVDNAQSERGAGPNWEIHGSVFMAEQPGNYSDANMSWGMGLPAGRIRSCSNNLMIWLGSGGYPADLPSCFTVIKNRDVWDAIKQNWIDCHPDVPRLASDPASNSSRCNANVYGGGGTQLP